MSEKVDLSSCRVEWDKDGKLHVVCSTPDQVAAAAKSITVFGVRVDLAPGGEKRD